MKSGKTLIAVLLTFLIINTYTGYLNAQTPSDDYFVRIETITDSFERIQAAMEVAFDPSVYVRSLQELRYDLKKFNETFANRKERRYLSFTLASSIERNYLSLVDIIRSNSEKVSQEDVNRVIDSNQEKISILRNSMKIENSDGPKDAWLKVVRDSMDSGDFNGALEYAKLARSTYGDEKEFRDLQESVERRLTLFEEDKTKAAGLIEEKKYRQAFVILEKIKDTGRLDTEIARMYETVSSYIERMDQLEKDAKAYEAEDRLKEAYRTWEKLLEYDPDNERAIERIAIYRQQLQLGTTEIVSTCNGCAGHGYCNICKGSGLCHICNGYRKCMQCRGAGYFARTCPFCICRDCRGTGACVTCEGRGTVVCTNCSGLGFVRAAETVACSVCRGSGRSRFTDRPCAACGGTGSVVTNVDKLCPVCRGSKALPCPTCNGNAKCRTCIGVGHLPNCNHCGGTGVLTSPCSACNRTGLCLECGGNGVCKYCKGSGKCDECNGAGIIVRKVDEEKYLSEKNHYISVTTEPAGASVYVDGKLRGESPLEIEDVKEGEHDIRISKPGYDDFRYKTVFTKNHAAIFDVRLTSKKASAYRVVGITRTRHTLLFRHYQGQEGDSFMISFHIDGANEWKELGDTVFGYEIAELKREFVSRFNPRLQEKQVLDLSSVILKKPDGAEIKLLKDNPMQMVVYSARIFDSNNRRFVFVSEGGTLGDMTVQNITDNEVILYDKSGTIHTLQRQ